MPARAGVLTPNNELANAELLGRGQLHHPEDIAFDQAGSLYTGCEDGKIYCLILSANGNVTKIEIFVGAVGFPLDLRFDGAGHLIAAVRGVGLLRQRTGKWSRNISAPLYRLRLALSRLWLDSRPHSLPSLDPE